MAERFGGGPQLTGTASVPVHGGKPPVSVQRGASLNTDDVAPLYTTANATADLVHRGAEWLKTNNGASASVDANGYPTEAAWLTIASNKGRFAAGNYTLSWSGSTASLASCTVIGGAVSTVASQTSLGGNSYTATVTLLSQGAIAVKTTAGASSISMSGVSETGTTLASEYTTTIARMTPRCLRVMDWQRINWAETSTNRTWDVLWSDRTKTTDCCWGVNKGVPAEMLIAAAETLSADLWLCLPHTAANPTRHETYIKNLATTIYAGRTDSKIIVEYGNELWNSNIGPGYWIENNRGETSAAEFAATMSVRTYAWFLHAWLAAGGSRSDLIFTAMGQQTAAAHASTTFLDEYTDQMIAKGFKPDMVGCAFYAKPFPSDIAAWKARGFAPSVQEYLDSGIGNCSVQLRAHLERAQYTQTSRSITYLGLYEGNISNKSRSTENWAAVAVDATLSSGIQDYVEAVAAECIAVDARYFCWLGFRRQKSYDLRQGNWGTAYDINNTDTYRWLGVVAINGGS